jgi:NAD(P)-dependent dehydrogenase (short-subunit alcohol dehydrogenase family)
MPGRIVLYGATGFMGALTARALVASGARPVLAGRDQSRLSTLAARLAQAGDGTELETAVAAGPGPLRDLIGAGDVLVSTAGPFMKIGRPVVAAAVDAGAVYLDSSGEPPFIREVFEEFGPRAGTRLGGGQGGRRRRAPRGRARPGRSLRSRPPRKRLRQRRIPPRARQIAVQADLMLSALQPGSGQCPRPRC